MLKIAVFGFYAPDQARIARSDPEEHLSPVSTDGFMQAVWRMQPPNTRIGDAVAAPRFVKLTRFTSQPVYVQALSNQMAPGAGLLNCDGYVAIIDAVKILAPRTIQTALRRLYALHPHADVIIAAGRQHEPDALSSDELREILGLHPDLPIFPYVPDEPETVHRLMERLIRYMDNPDRIPPPIFAGDQPPADGITARADGSISTHESPVLPVARIHGLDHVAITVSDLTRALDFYRGLLGFRLLGHLDFPQDERGFTIAYLDTGRGVLELFSFEKAETHSSGWMADDMQVGLRHVALRVTGLDAIAAQLMHAGVPFTMPPTDAVGGVRIAFFTDPDGTLLELIEGDLIYSRR